MRPFFLLAAVFSVFSGNVSAQERSEEALIRLARAGFNDAIASHDVPRILTYLEEGYRVSTSDGGFLDGRSAMGEAFAARFNEYGDATYVRTPETIEINPVGPVAAEVGRWVGSWTTDEGPFRTGGRYVAHWRKVEGRWLVHSELYVPLFCEGPGCG